MFAVRFSGQIGAYPMGARITDRGRVYREAPGTGISGCGPGEHRPVTG